MPHDELVKRLRCQLYGNCPACVNWYAEEVEPNLWRERCLAIDAADAIEELEKEVQNWKITAGEEASGLEHWFENYQKDIPHWIPVTERLPNCNGCYLVWRPHFFGGEIGMPSICYFDGTNTWHDSYGVDFTRILHSEDVTHWMPLPQSPKDGES